MVKENIKIAKKTVAKGEIFKFRGIEVSNLYETCDMIGGEAKGHGLFVDFYVSQPATYNENIDMRIPSAIVKGAIRKRSHNEFQKAIHKAVREYMLQQQLTPFVDYLQDLVFDDLMTIEQMDAEINKFIASFK